MSTLDTLVRLLVITVLAGAIGYERERHGRAAGFRTHILVGVGSCLVMLTGLYLMNVYAGLVEFDPTRMASQVISGIGFLGAGTILRFRASVRGLTTAASLWAVAGIGLAAGAGFFVGAIATGVIVMAALFALGRWERAMRKDIYHQLTVAAPSSADQLARVRRVLADYEVEIKDFDVTPDDEPGCSRIEFDVKLLSDHHQSDILRDLLRLEGVRRAHWS